MREYCPYCKKEVDYKIENRDVKEFRGIEIDTYENVAVCKECHQDLYVNEIEEKNNERIYELYRAKANIIKPQDIIELRKKYDISQRELTAILGFGKMTINRYERGGVPTKSQSDYIRLLIDNDNKFIEKVKEAYKNGNINDKTYGKSSTFTVNANQNVSWNIEAAEKPSYRYTYNAYKNKTATSVTGEYTIDSIVESTGAISKISSDVKVTATTKAEQKLSLIINKYVA